MVAASRDRGRRCFVQTLTRSVRMYFIRVSMDSGGSSGSSSIRLISTREVSATRCFTIRFMAAIFCASVIVAENQSVSGRGHPVEVRGPALVDALLR